MASADVFSPPADREEAFEALSRELAEKELELATLENELAVFERHYASTVGILFAELDRLDREIAREMERMHPEEAYRQTFRRAEEKARASQEAVGGVVETPGKPLFHPSEELKNLYRKIAKLIHPDLAAGEADRAYRTRLMARANEAYKNSDLEALEQILYEWEHRDEQAIQAMEMDHGTEDVGEVVNPLEQMIARIHQRLVEINRKLSELKQSERYLLMKKVEQAAHNGRDLLAEMVSELLVKVRAAQGLLDNLRSQV